MGRFHLCISCRAVVAFLLLTHRWRCSITAAHPSQSLYIQSMSQTHGSFPLWQTRCNEKKNISERKVLFLLVSALMLNKRLHWNHDSGFLSSCKQTGGNIWSLVQVQEQNHQFDIMETTRRKVNETFTVWRRVDEEQSIFKSLRKLFNKHFTIFVIHCSKKLKEHFFIRVWHDFNCTSLIMMWSVK